MCVCVCFFGVWLCGCMDAWVEAACWCGSQFLRREHSGYPTPWRGGGVCGTGAGRVPGSRGLLHRRCVCVYLAFPMLWGPTRTVIPVHFVVCECCKVSCSRQKKQVESIASRRRDTVSRALSASAIWDGVKYGKIRSTKITRHPPYTPPPGQNSFA